MTGAAVRQVWEAIWPQQESNCRCQPCGVIARQRPLHLGRCVRARVIAAGTPGGASQADGLREYLECDGPHVARAACSRWCDAPLERVRAAPAELASASLAPLRACHTHRVRFVIRMQEHWTPTVDALARGQVTQECFPGSAFDALPRGPLRKSR